jgi:hypothetical protein
MKIDVTPSVYGRINNPAKSDPPRIQGYPGYTSPSLRRSIPEV